MEEKLYYDVRCDLCADRLEMEIEQRLFRWKCVTYVLVVANLALIFWR